MSEGPNIYLIIGSHAIIVIAILIVNIAAYVTEEKPGKKLKPRKKKHAITLKVF